MILTEYQLAHLRSEHHQPSSKPPCRGNARVAVADIVALAATGMRHTHIAQQLGVSQPYVSRILAKHRAEGKTAT